MLHSNNTDLCYTTNKLIVNKQLYSKCPEVENSLASLVISECQRWIYIDGLVQDYSISNGEAIVLHQAIDMIIPYRI